jgi:predicted secreted hydrolase
MDRHYENPSSWSIRDLHIAHFAVTDVAEKQFFFFEKINRRGPGIAGTSTTTLDVWNENWSARLDGPLMRLRANAGEVEISLTLEAQKPPAVHGIDGISRKADGEGHTSHYYSLTRMTTTGTVRIGANTHPVTGESWMDHEFGTNQLAENQAGWDWLGLQLDNGSELMLYRMRHRNGAIDPNSAGTIVETNAQTRRLNAADFTMTPLREWSSTATGAHYPVEWTISMPAEQTELHVSPLIDHQELVTRKSTGIAYWEGAVTVTGTWHGQSVSGRGYMELTGYTERDRPGV